MSDKSYKVTGSLIAIGIICAAVLTLLDYKIKNDLIYAAKELERKLNEYTGQGQANIVDNSDDSVHSSIPLHTENSHHTRMEMEGPSEEIPESSEVKTHGKARDNLGRFQAKSE